MKHKQKIITISILTFQNLQIERRRRMSFEAKDYPISDILNKVVFDIPRNQRRYVWKKSSWQDLFEDVLFSITEEKPHFIGSIVLKKGSKKDGLSYYTIIDGQQRITTITLFLVAIMKHFHENDMMDDFWGTVSYLQSRIIEIKIWLFLIQNFIRQLVISLLV